MEAFSLLKYWRGGGATSNAAATTIVTAVTHHGPDTDDDDGPFFDLELTVPPDEDEHAKLEDVDEDEDEDEEKEDDGFEFDATTDGEDDDDDDDDEREFNLSPSDDLFFNGRLVPIAESKTKLQSSLLKSSATKFRVMMLKLKKSKANVGVKKEETTEKQKQSKFFTVKLNVEEVPIVSLFTRDNSSRSSSGTQKQQSSDESAFEEKKFSKYLKKVKPLYVRVSKRYGEKQRFSGQLNSSPAKSTVAKRESEQAEAAEQPPAAAAAASNGKSQKQGSLPAGLRVVCKHLGKSRSASAATPCSGSIQAKRNDDSFLQQQDGIQSAILHCKRSFNEQKSKDSDLSALFRSVSDTSHEKSMNTSMKCSMKCSEELKETGI